MKTKATLASRLRADRAKLLTNQLGQLRTELDSLSLEMEAFRLGFTVREMKARKAIDVVKNPQMYN